MHLGMAFWGSKTLLTAVELGLFSELAKGPLSADDVRDRLKLHDRGARDFMDALVALGMLERDEGTYRNTSESDLFLDRAKPSYIGGILEMANARLYPNWGLLTEAPQTGVPQNEAKDGGNFFDALYADPAQLQPFLQAMTGLSIGVGAAMAQRFTVEPVQDVHRRGHGARGAAGADRARARASDGRRLRSAAGGPNL